MQDKVELLDFTGLSLGEILERCKQLPAGHGDFLLHPLCRCHRPRFVPRSVLQSLAAHAEAPIFGPYEMYMGSGIVGGPLISLLLQGKKAAEVALRLLQGQAPKMHLRPAPTPTSASTTGGSCRAMQSMKASCLPQARCFFARPPFGICTSTTLSA